GQADLAEESPRLRARLLDVASVAGELLQFLERRGPRGAGDLDAAHFPDHGDPREVLRGLPAVEGQSESAPHALVVERLALVVDGHQREAIPPALLHRDLGPEGLHKAVALGWREAAELRMRALAADGRDLGGRRGDEDGAITVEVGLPLVPVVRVLLPHEVRALDVLHELEGAGAHGVRLIP